MLRPINPELKKGLEVQLGEETGGRLSELLAEVLLELRRLQLAKVDAVPIAPKNSRRVQCPEF